MSLTSALPDPVAELLAEVEATRLPPPGERAAIREAAGVSARAMARACRVTVTTILKWEAGATPRPAHARVYGAALRGLREVVR